MIDMTSELIEMTLALRASPYQSVRKEYKEPLSREDALLIDLVANRYIGNSGTPVMSFSSGGYTRMIVPTDLRLKRKGE